MLTAIVRTEPRVLMHVLLSPTFSAAPALLGFIQEQMALYKVSHAVARRQASAQYEVKTGALSAGSDLYRARMTAEAAQTYCGTNLACAGFTWQSATKLVATASAKEKDELPLIFFKGGE